METLCCASMGGLCVTWDIQRYCGTACWSGKKRALLVAKPCGRTEMRLVLDVTKEQERESRDACSQSWLLHIFAHGVVLK